MTLRTQPLLVLVRPPEPIDSFSGMAYGPIVSPDCGLSLCLEPNLRKLRLGQLSVSTSGRWALTWWLTVVTFRGAWKHQRSLRVYHWFSHVAIWASAYHYAKV